MSDSVRPHRRQPTRLLRPWDSPGKNTGVGCHFLLQCMKVKSESEVAQSCQTLSDPMDHSPPGSSIHGILQARVLEWVAIAFSEIHPISVNIINKNKLITSGLGKYFLIWENRHKTLRFDPFYSERDSKCLSFTNNRKVGGRGELQNNYGKSGRPWWLRR